MLKDFYPIFVFDEAETNSNRIKMLEEFDSKYNENEALKQKNKMLLEKLYDTIENVGVIANVASLQDLKPESMIEVVRERVVKTKLLRDFYTMKTATEFITNYLSEADADIDKILINRLLLTYLPQNVAYSEDLTRQSEEQALASLSVTFGMVQKDELIITEGELITDEKYNILNSLKTEYSMMDEDNFFNRNHNLYGQIILVSLVFLTLFYAIKLLRPDLLPFPSG